MLNVSNDAQGGYSKVSFSFFPVLLVYPDKPLGLLLIVSTGNDLLDFSCTPMNMSSESFFLPPTYDQIYLIVSEGIRQQ